MRKITRPEPLQLTDGKPYSFNDFVRTLLSMDQRFNVDMRAAFAAERIETALKLEPEGAELELETTDGDLLKEAAANPSNGYPIRPSLVLAPFLRAIAES